MEITETRCLGLGRLFPLYRGPKGRPWPNKYQVNLRKGMEGDWPDSPDAKNKVP